MQDAAAIAYGVMARHKAQHRQNPMAALRSGLLEALPELRTTLVAAWSELEGADEPPLRDELAKVIADRISAFIQSCHAVQQGSAGTARTSMNLISRFTMGVARDLELAVHARRKQTRDTAPSRGGGVATHRVSTLVLMSVNPETEEEDEQLLVLNEEQKVYDARDSSRFQDWIRIEPLRDAKFARLAKSLRLHKPIALHLSGHGQPDGSIVLFDEENQPYAMTAEGLAKLFCVHKDTLKLIVLSACHSQVLAMLLTGDIDVVIGMTGEIDDDAAILFSDVLYNALFDGASVGDAFNTAHSALIARHPGEAQYPRLTYRAGVDPARLRIVE